MSTVTSYALVTEDPACSAHIALVVDGDQGELELKCGEATASDSGQQIPGRDEYIYHFRVSGLSSDTVYEVTVDGLLDAEIKTAPYYLPEEGVRIVAIGDPHVELDSSNMPCMDDPSDMDDVTAEKPDYFLIAGDGVYASTDGEFSSSNGEKWITAFRDYFSKIKQGKRLIPIFYTPGNHDVGNHNWDGTGSTSPFETYFNVFCPNNQDMGQSGNNNASSMLGNWCQLLAIDTHSARASETREWMDDGVINPQVPVVIPFYHSPLCSADIRLSNDLALQENLRNAVFRAFHEHSNVRFGFSGHIHTRTRTKRLTVTEEEPAGDYFELTDPDGNNEGYVVVTGSGGFTEIGQGYRKGRTDGNKTLWFLEYADNSEYNWNVVDITPDEVKVKTRGHGDKTYWTRTHEIAAPRPPGEQYGDIYRPTSDGWEKTEITAQVHHLTPEMEWDR